MDKLRRALSAYLSAPFLRDLREKKLLLILPAVPLAIGIAEKAQIKSQICVSFTDSSYKKSESKKLRCAQSAYLSAPFLWNLREK